MWKGPGVGSGGVEGTWGAEGSGCVCVWKGAGIGKRVGVQTHFAVSPQAFPSLPDFGGGLLQSPGHTVIYIRANTGKRGFPRITQGVVAQSELRFTILVLLYCQFKHNFMHQEAENGPGLNLRSTSSLLYGVG